MAETNLLAPEAEAQIGALGSADLVVAVTAGEGSEDPEPTLASVRTGLKERFPDLRAALLHVHAGGKAVANTNGDDVSVLDLPLAAGVEPSPREAALRLVIQAGRKLGARGSAVVGAEVSSLTPGWIGRLLGPVVDQEIDLVTPYYLRHPYSGAVTSGILYPLIRVLYGRRVRFPLGLEFACSARLLERHAAGETGRGRPGPLGMELRLLAGAVAGGFRMCQAVLGPRTVVAAEMSTSPSAVLTVVLSQVFSEMERSTALWQKIRGSVAVDLQGTDDPAGIEPVAVDRKRLVDAFRLGQQNLAEVWGLVLPPGTLLELKRMARTPDAEIRMVDRLWARILYDFSLAYHTRIMSRDHLMGALAPLYLGWFASWSTEMGDCDPVRLEDRLEQMCLQFEAEKPYLISRWRWPDRFNP